MKGGQKGDWKGDTGDQKNIDAEAKHPVASGKKVAKKKTRQKHQEKENVKAEEESACTQNSE